MTLPVPAEEQARLAALRRYDILDTPPEREFDDLARLAAYICDAPIAAINLIDSARLWAKAQVGFRRSEMPRDDTLCSYTIRMPGLLIVPDLRADPLFATDPRVTAPPHLRFYAGAPLTTPDGFALGTICVMDHTPRELNEAQQEALRALARQVMTQLELRRAAQLLHQAALAREEVEAVLRVRTAAVDAASSGVLITDPALPDNPIIYANPAFEALTGYQASEVLGRNCRFLQGPETDGGTVAQLRRAIAEGRPITVPLRNYRKDGTPFWQELAMSPVRDPQGRVTHFVGIQTDITARREAEEEARHQAMHDALTDLPNRRLLHAHLEHALRARPRSGMLVALLLLDLDGFKEVNDRRGHHMGDLLLQHVGWCLRGVLRASDTAARLGGDEFAVLLPQVHTREDSILVAERIAAALAQPLTVDGLSLEVRASLGIALAPEHGEDATVLLRHADVAMYRAKKARGAYAVFAPEQDHYSPAGSR